MADAGFGECVSCASPCARHQLRARLHAGIDKTRLLAGVLETAAWRVGEGGLCRVVDRLLGRVGGRALRKSRAERHHGDLFRSGQRSRAAEIARFDTDRHRRACLRSRKRLLVQQERLVGRKPVVVLEQERRVRPVVEALGVDVRAAASVDVAAPFAGWGSGAVFSPAAAPCAAPD